MRLKETLADFIFPLLILVIFLGLLLGTFLGTVLALKIATTAMPQLVAIFNGFGGAASAIVAGAVVEITIASGGTLTVQAMIASSASGLIGSVTLLGSLTAFGKLQGLITEQPGLIPGRHLFNGLMIIGCVGLAIWFLTDPSYTLPFWILVAVASTLGIFLVLPIGGADMPVIIALLNSYSGLAAAATGFVLDNNMLIIAGSLVGAAGFILTSLMSKAMNRSLSNVLFAGVGAVSSSSASSEDIYAGRVKSGTPEEIAILLESAQRVVIVPGFGMAVAQAQYAVRDLVNVLESKGITTEFGIHPVAGRMPGHMNVLLAEVDISYDKLKDMDQINPSFRETDVVLVIGANDVVNPSSRDNDPSNPIMGMPILDVDQARSVVIIKRSLSPGFAGIPNPLFAADNALMLYGDAKEMVTNLTAATKA